jgi:hypothetical protein
MGWNREINRLASAQRRAERQQQVTRNKINRTADSHLRRIDQCADRALKQFLSALDKIEKDPVSALNADYSLSEGFSFEPIELDADLFSGKVQIVNDEPESHPTWSLQPDTLQNERYRISVLDALPTRVATFVAFYIDNQDDEYQIRLNWMKKSDPQTSPVYLINIATSEYHFPIATNLKGEVVANHPRIGVLAFAPFKNPTNEFAVHFSNLKLTSERTKYSFDITCTSASLGSIISEQLSAEDIRTSAETRIETLRRELISSAQDARSSSLKSASGCLVAISVPVSALVALYLLL